MTQETAHCPRCDKAVRPVVEFSQGGRMLDLCPYCQSSVTPALPAAPAPRPQVVIAAAKSPIVAGAGTVLDFVRQQLAEKRAKLGDLVAAYAEVAMLERMVEAAEAVDSVPAARLPSLNGASAPH